MEAFLTQFALDESQILPLLESVLGSPLVGFTVPLPDTENPYGSDKQLIDFRCLLPNGEAAKKTVFVKKCVWKSKSESVHYRYLTAKGVPTPRLYGAVQNAAGVEVVFLEPLTSTGFQEQDETEWREMLSLLARFNACPIMPQYNLHLHPYEQVGQIDENFWVTGLNARPSDEEIEIGLRASGVSESEMPRLTQAARRVFAEVEAQPRGLLHQDFLPDNLGWRGAREEIVVFDLHKNSLGSRFADVSPYLGVPDWSGRQAFLDHSEHGTCTRREALTQHYLAEYARFGGAQVSIEVFRAETAALFWAHKVSVLPWLAERNQEEAMQEVLEFLRHSPVGI